MKTNNNNIKWSWWYGNRIRSINIFFLCVLGGGMLYQWTFNSYLNIQLPTYSCDTNKICTSLILTNSSVWHRWMRPDSAILQHFGCRFKFRGLHFSLYIAFRRFRVHWVQQAAWVHVHAVNQVWVHIHHGTQSRGHQSNKKMGSSKSIVSNKKSNH